MKSLPVLIVASLSSVFVFGADPFAENVRTTDPLTPEEQVKTFRLPPGFKAELVVAEPDIQKPMNMAFDTKGRLWVTTSREYPYPAPVDKPGRDSIKVLEDFDGNGRARKVTTFVEGLNIPIGLYPYKDGVIAWSIPNIWFFRDTDGDGKADRREVLFGPLGWERDTHGNQASFRRGYDGWLYLTHGYNNISTIRGKDGSEITLHSGNTYRVRTDGSRVEPHTWGQVNPFGICFDPAGNLYSADCHSAPIYELLRGGYYPSFGKPHDGLGFAPTLMEHSHGSTAICGIIYYADDLWPDEFQNNIFIGNVMTSRINRDTLISRGSSKTAREEPDFLSTTDPWFRPVDLQLGPDGALYVADFYNRIIGHYEVPLNHPGRDRERGRIWRVSYTGKPTRNLPNFSRANGTQLVAEFRSPNLTRRMLAMDELVDRLGSSAIPQLEQVVNNSAATGPELVHTLWSLQRLGALEEQVLRKSASHTDGNVRTHAMRILAENADYGSLRQTAGLQALKDEDPLVQRAAAEALGVFPEAEVYVRPLLALLSKVPSEDDHLRHTVRMALRNQLREGGPALSYRRYRGEDAQVIADACLSIPNADAAAFLLEHVRATRPAAGKAAEYVRHASRHADEEAIPKLSVYVRENFRNDVDRQLSFFRAIQEGSAQRGLQLGPETRSWGGELAEDLLKSADSENIPWRNIPLVDRAVTTNPWLLQKRLSADGDRESVFLCSLPPGGEHLTGILRSRPFSVPGKLRFYLAGHDGFPNRAPQGNNFVRLIRVDGKVLKKTPPPRNDTAQLVEWDLAESEGKEGYLEIVDGDTGSAYAWLAAGRFEPNVAPLPPINPSQISARIQAASDLAKTLQLTALAPRLGSLLAHEAVDTDAQAALASALVALEPNEQRLALAPLLGDNSIPAQLRQRIAHALATGGDDSHEVLLDAMKSAPARAQLKLAQALAGSVMGVETLFGLVEKSLVSPRVLLDKTVQDKIAALNSSGLRSRHTALTENLEPASEAMQKIIDVKRASYNPARASAVDGAAVYVQNCAVCHQIDGNGSLIGPQLDGIGSRGLERILEDIIDPNRNLDVNFRTQIVVLNDGDVVTGLLRREEGEVIVLADSTGKEISIPKSEIESRRESESSLMPSNFTEIIPEDDFQNLMAFLLSKSAPPAQ